MKTMCPASQRLLMLSTLLISGVSALGSDVPALTFDVADMISCQDVTPANYASNNSDEKLVEARFRISTRIDRGDDKELKDLSIEIVNPARTMKLVDFLPKTQLSTDVDGTIEIVEDVNKTTNLAASIKPQFTVAYKVADQQFNGGISAASLDASQTNKRDNLKKYKLLPEKNVLLSSGSTNRGYGVYYKLKPSSQTSFLGQHEYSCIFEVPKDWQGNWVVLTCGARAYKTSLLRTKTEVCAGFIQTYVPLYLQGDNIAKQKARKIADIIHEHSSTLEKLAHTDQDHFFHRMNEGATKTRAFQLANYSQANKDSSMNLWWLRSKPVSVEGASQREVDALKQTLQQALSDLNPYSTPTLP